MSKVIHVNQQQFQAEVLNSSIPVLVDFYANWCPPCRALAPMLDQLAEDFDGQIKFVKINSDEESGLARSFKVTGLPTVMFFENGAVVGQFSGLPQKAALRAELKKWIDTQKATAR